MHFPFQDQYKFIYDTLEEFVICGVSWFPVKQLTQRLKMKSVRDSYTKLNEYQREYQVSQKKNLECTQPNRFIFPQSHLSNTKHGDSNQVQFI